MFPIIAAYANGENVQIDVDGFGQWTKAVDVDFSLHESRYRIKPEPRKFWICGPYSFGDLDDAKKYSTTLNVDNNRKWPIIPVVEIL